MTSQSTAMIPDVTVVALWIGEIYFDPLVVQKLREKHDLDPATVIAAVAQGAHDRASWHDHEVYGRPLVVTGGVDLITYLRPLDESDGLWECLTAWRLET